MTVRINKQKINLREKLAEFEDKVNFDEVVRGLGENTAPLILNKDGGNVGIGTTDPQQPLHVKSQGTADVVGLFESQDSKAYLRIKDSGSSGGAFIGADGTDTILGTGGSTIRMQIKSNGNVGIGTTDPRGSLHVNGSNFILGQGHNTASPAAGSIVAPYGVGEDINGGNLNIYAGRSTGTGVGGNISFYTSSVSETSGSAANNHVNRLLIESDGNVLIGKTTSAQNTAGTQISATAGARITVDGNVSAILNRLTSDGSVASFRKDGTEKGSISVTSTATAYNTSSDYRLKTDVQPITDATERLKALKPVNFEWISDGTRVDGFLAHETQEVVPEAVTGTKDAMQTEEYEVTPAVYEDVIIPAVDEVVDEDGNVTTEAQEERVEQKLISEAVMGEREVPDYQGIDQSKLVPLLTAAIQEQQSIIEDLKSRIETLESK